jgi:hypothetical protein
VIERFRRDDVEAEARPLRDRLARLVESLPLSARPQVPDALDDRAAESWEVLLAIADAVGGDWGTRARQAAIELQGSRDQDEEALSLVLLRDVRDAFATRTADRLATSELLEHLHGLEASPWGEYFGKPLSAHGLAKLLRSYRIEPRNLRVGADVRKGYLREHFADAFERYLSPDPPTGPETATSLQGAQTGAISVADSGGCSDVADFSGAAEWEGTSAQGPKIATSEDASDADRADADKAWRDAAVAEVASWPPEFVAELVRLQGAGTPERTAFAQVLEQMHEPAGQRCYACGGTDFWAWGTGAPTVCAACHPPMGPPMD